MVKGFAPYGRLAYERNFGRHSLEVGLYGAQFRLYPGGAPDAAVPLAGLTNEFRDIAEDVQYQFLGDRHLFSITATRIHESMSLDASYSAGGSANRNNDLTTYKINGTYYYRHMIGGTLGYFSTKGSADAALYPSIPADDTANPGVITSASNRPDTSGFVAEVNYLPWLNTKFAVQYTAYSKFNGGSSNYDGAGRSAHDNNTLYLLAWFSY